MISVLAGTRIGPQHAVMDTLVIMIAKLSATTATVKNLMQKQLNLFTISVKTIYVTIQSPHPSPPNRRPSPRVSLKPRSSPKASLSKMLF
ncbi:MAG: hypothetical protein H0X26_01470 [Alphaproteobacteria bacterium]|nr:hypothetical protein [Alphaproteobacteria bacterium]